MADIFFLSEMLGLVSSLGLGPILNWTPLLVCDLRLVFTILDCMQQINYIFLFYFFIIQDYLQKP